MAPPPESRWTGGPPAPPLPSTAQSAATHGTSSSKSLSPTCQPDERVGGGLCDIQATVTGASSDRQITEGEKYKPGKKPEERLKGREEEGTGRREGMIVEEKKRRYSPCPIVCPCLEE